MTARVTANSAMDIHFRIGMPADLEALIALSRENISEAYASFLGKETVDAYLQSGAVKRYLAENVSDCTVIVCGSKIVGYSVQKQNLIDLMMIDLRHQRRGLGTALLQRMEDTLFQSHQSLRLESFKENAAANAFYRKNGWLEFRTFREEESGIEKIEFRKSKIG